MSPEEMKQLEQALGPIMELVSKGGWSLMAVPVVLMAVVNFYRLPIVQALLLRFAPKLAWENLPGLAKLAIPFGLAAAGAFIAAKTGAVSIPAAVIGAIVAGLSAVFGHHGAKAVAGTGVAVKAASKMPVSISRPLSLVVPMDWSKVMAERVRGKLSAVK